MQTTIEQTDKPIEGTYESKKAFIKGVTNYVHEYISIKFRGRRDNVSSTVYECLLGNDFDHQSEVYNIKSTSLDIIEALSSKESREKFTDSQLHNAIKLLKGFIDFATYLEDDKTQADLDAVYLDNYGTQNLECSARLKENYIKKIKLANYEIQLDGE